MKANGIQPLSEKEEVFPNCGHFSRIHATLAGSMLQEVGISRDWANK